MGSVIGCFLLACYVVVRDRDGVETLIASEVTNWSYTDRNAIFT